MNFSEDASPASPLSIWIRRIAILMISLGAVGFVAAVAWWFMFFEKMLGTDVKTASECFYRTTLECQVGNFVGLFMEMPPYEPMFMWAMMAAMITGFLVYILTSES